MPSPLQELVSASQFLHVTYTMILLASIFVIARIGIQIWIRRAMETQDYFLYAAFIFFLAMSICFIVVIPAIIALSKIQGAMVEPQPATEAKIALYIQMIFVSTSLFWLSLWSVKLSFLALYKKLIQGLPVIYLRLWWALLTFCILGLLGCFVSYITSCPDFLENMRGHCPNGERTVRGQLASLYGSYAVDILSDLMIMFLPIRLVWSLQMRLGQKIAVMALFASGFICIAFATLRVVQTAVSSENNSTPNPTWLALWTVIEGGVALCIGCGPAFAVLYRSTQTRQSSFNTHGYFRHAPSRSGTDPSRQNTIKMNSVTISTGRTRFHRHGTYWDDTKSSQEELAAESKGITVTTTLEQNHRTSKTNV